MHHTLAEARPPQPVFLDCRTATTPIPHSTTPPPDSTSRPLILSPLLHAEAKDNNHHALPTPTGSHTRVTAGPDSLSLAPSAANPQLHAEAKDNVKFLTTLERHFKNVTSGSFSVILETLESLMNAIRMVWIISRHYNTDERMVRPSMMGSSWTAMCFGRLGGWCMAETPSSW